MSLVAPLSNMAYFMMVIEVMSIIMVNGKVQYFGNHSYSLSWQELDEKTTTTFMSVC